MHLTHKTFLVSVCSETNLEAKVQMHLVQKLWKEGHSSLGLAHKDESRDKKALILLFYVRSFQIYNISGVLVPIHAHSDIVTLKFSLSLIYSPARVNNRAKAIGVL